MSSQQLVERIVAAESGINGMAIKTGNVSEAGWPQLTSAAVGLKNVPVYIDDSPSLSVVDVRARARRIMARHGLGLVIVDYLQIMRGGKRRESREQQVAEMSRGLKSLAKELGIPVMALSQLNRGVDSRSDKRPMLSDLRESGAIEQDADLILFIYRDEVYRKTDTNRGLAELIIGKQRSGPTGIVKMFFDKSVLRFTDA
jgi:replicative DNA helicase